MDVWVERIDTGFGEFRNGWGRDNGSKMEVSEANFENPCRPVH
jgi:hypothetical protein